VLEGIQAENELALAHGGCARLLCDQGRIESAREHLGRALKILERLGTLREPERVRRDLAALEPPPRGGLAGRAPRQENDCTQIEYKRRPRQGLAPRPRTAAEIARWGLTRRH
jgi:hypothetical protein